MKKSILALAMAFGVSSAFAQDLTSKKGEPILPEAGDYSIGIDATPVLNYFGNMLSSAGNTAPTWNNYGANQTLVGKYFLSEKSAVRVTLRLGRTSFRETARMAKFSATAPTAPTAANSPDGLEYVFDTHKSVTNNIGLGFGYEMRKGKTRLQGFYGGELFFLMSGQKDKYTYGNVLDYDATGAGNDVDADDANYVKDFGSNIIPGIPNYSNINSGRMLSAKTNRGFLLGVRGFIGAEFFIMPKLSIGGEFGWGVGYIKNLKSKYAAEVEGTAVGGTTEETATIEYQDQTPGTSGFLIDTDRNPINGASYNFSPSGTLRLNFHF